MTHKDIYEKFMIEYDKDNVTSSYPSLTRKEQATILDKAYLALIAQKMTGNNVRRSRLETDIKSISDLQPLICTVDDSADFELNLSGIVPNVVGGELPDDFLYFVSGYVHVENSQILPIQIVDHNTAKRFFATPHNKPWIKTPVCYIEENIMYVVYDLQDYEDGFQYAGITYVMTPAKFVSDTDSTPFELNDSMAEELISLAITFALENVESQRLNTKLNTRGLEA